jgi:hypothetical protein
MASNVTSTSPANWPCGLTAVSAASASSTTMSPAATIQNSRATPIPQILPAPLRTRAGYLTCGTGAACDHQGDKLFGTD